VKEVFKFFSLPIAIGAVGMVLLSNKNCLLSDAVLDFCEHKGKVNQWFKVLEPDHFFSFNVDKTYLFL
jgi:hypothetical protein